MRSHRGLKRSVLSHPRHRTNSFHVQSSGATDACYRSAARNFAYKAFRGDVSSEKLDLVATFFADGVKTSGIGQAIAELIEVVLSSPDFLFRKEIDVDRSRRLAPHQFLQALSYTIADVPPDQLSLNPSEAQTYFRRGVDSEKTLEDDCFLQRSTQQIVALFQSVARSS